MTKTDKLLIFIERKMKECQKLQKSVKTSSDKTIHRLRYRAFKEVKKQIEVINFNPRRPFKTVVQAISYIQERWGEPVERKGKQYFHKVLRGERTRTLDEAGVIDTANDYFEDFEESVHYRSKYIEQHKLIPGR